PDRLDGSPRLREGADWSLPSLERRLYRGLALVSRSGGRLAAAPATAATIRSAVGEFARPPRFHVLHLLLLDQAWTRRRGPREVRTVSATGSSAGAVAERS